ncbi:histidinol dehydrogenase [Candidatus Palauibacter polyketidifaciens]|uniref:histidinol dehydrogenase n=1 Tax=Candidatus Palauibacter polyketidifaciens TaxID=3056740 RepID=UPI00139EDDFA|nr:histidinol dehydrogenase [Candidatus Palauibacter polyketidifaciens]MDE2720599.1 histidinol dehydrogenase [Candidatus Palauibacter polyketidifaciens]MYE34061.1 histidinol dehydrogenase [Gemmatimonadales bacterium]
MIIPSIDLMGGRAVQLRQGATLEIDAGDPRPLAERFAVAGEVAVIDLDAALGRGDNAALIRELLPLAPCRVGGGIRSREAALDWLDAGARQVILGTAANPDVLGELPAERVIAALDARDGEVVVEGWQRGTGRGVIGRMEELDGLASGYLVTFVEVEGTLGGIPLDRVAALVAAAGSARVTVAGGVREVSEIAALDRMGADAQVGMAIYSGRMELGDAIAAPLKSDRADGLWATVVEDTGGRALGLAWSSAESLRTAVRERRGVYQSRSRGLWRKGETSGATQELVRVAADCDRDTLRFTVRQHGTGFCHTGTRTCFDDPVDLETRLRERLADPEPGSLTARLAGDPELLRGKLVEEAQELAEAGSKADAVAEFADLYYFALTRLLKAGGSLEDVRLELERRALKVRRRAPRAPGEATGRTASAPAAAAGGILPPIGLDEAVRAVRSPALDPAALEVARTILDDVERRGEPALREHAERLGDLEPGDDLLLDRSALERAAEALHADDRELLNRVADRIRAFAEAQRASANDLETPVAGGRGGHRLAPVGAAGCYAPGGRFPLPSSVLMTVIPARVAGVDDVWAASPRPTAAARAAAFIAGADGLLAIGGAQAIGALAFGVGGVSRCEKIVGPGNRFVTAAKRLLYGRVGLDTIAGPSELLVVASPDAEPARVAADLLAQAEHDPDAVPLLCAFDEATVEAVREETERQLATLPTAPIARQALAAGGALLVASLDEAAAICDAVAPEHLQLHGERAEPLAPRVHRYGSLFMGAATPEAAGDYGAGPNHTLPTSGAAAFDSGLSVFSFLRRPTWLTLSPEDDAYEDLLRDTAALARLEGLEAHALSAELRLTAAARGDRRRRVRAS